jgi:esterase/lipase superfamily enzyme
MTPLKKRLLIAGAFILLLLLALSAFFYRPTRLALERAESFHFRRMVVAQEGEKGSYRFFYVSNRVLEPGPGSPEDRFNNERQENLKFGRFDTRIEPTLGLGMIINPTDWFQNEELTVSDVSELDRAVFINELLEQLEQSPSKSLLVLVHGYRNSFPTSLRMTAFVGHVLDINTPVLVFDWPGDQGSGIRGYRRAQQIARDSGTELAKTLEMVIREIQPGRLWVLANSMGGQVVADSFSLLYQQDDLADAQTEIDDVVLTAPDVGQDDFDQQFKHEITALARDLTVYASSNDRALLASRFVNRQRRLGTSPPNILNPDQTKAAASILDIMEPGSKNITLVDVTPVNRTRNFHNFSLETPEFFDDLFLRLTNEETPQNRLLYPFQVSDGDVFWVLTQGR